MVQETYEAGVSPWCCPQSAFRPAQTASTATSADEEAVPETQPGKGLTTASPTIRGRANTAPDVWRKIKVFPPFHNGKQVQIQSGQGAVRHLRRVLSWPANSRLVI